MAIVGCFVTPHPPIVIPEVGGAELANADATVKAMVAVGEEAVRLDPDTIVLLSPHAPLARSQMGVSLAAAYSGSLAFFRAPQVNLRAEGDQGLAKAIIEAAAAHGIPVISTTSATEVVDLDHGAMVPLYYLMGGLKKKVKLVLLSFSYLSMEEHVRFGEAVGQALAAGPDRIIYVASADLSHRLLPGAPAGYDPRAAQFDRTIADTFARGDWKGMMAIDPGLVQAAGECGYRSLAVLSGIVDWVESSGVSTRNRFFSYEGPFGVGYMVGQVVIAPAGEQAQVTS
jgi:aromatic ring-opening dioxygenase LigB subunit